MKKFGQIDKFWKEDRGAKFCKRKKFGAKKLQTKDFEIENLEINVLTQTFKTIKNQRNKQLSRACRTDTSWVAIMRPTDPHVHGHLGHLGPGRLQNQYPVYITRD